MNSIFLLMKNKLFVHITLVVLILLACQSTTETQELTNDLVTNKIEFEVDDPRLKKIFSQILSPGEYADTVFCNGVVQAPPQSVFSVYSLIRGFVHDIAVYPGSPVKKGQLLCKISHPDIFSIQQKLVSDYSQFKTDSLEYIRQKMLFDDSATSARQFELAKSVYYSSMANHLAQKKQLSSIGFNIEKILEGQLYSDVVIRSPTDGIISSVFTNTGSLIENNMHLFTILNTSHIHFEIFLQPSDYQKVRGLEYLYVSTLSDPTYRKAQIINVSNFVENPTMSVVLHCHPVDDRTDVPIIGESISSYFLTNVVTGYAIPRNSIFHFNNKDYIFSRTDFNHFELLEVTVKRKYPSLFIVDVSSENDLQVVTKGAHLLKEKLMKED